MKRIITLFVVIVMVLSMAVVTSSAEEIPTAKIVASLVGDAVPVVGEKFTVAISVEDISSGLFVSGEAILNWPAEVASLADSYYDEPVIVTDDYCLGNIYNQKIGRTGKFEYISNFDRASSGRAAVAIYISLSAGDQNADVVSDLTMFEISFTLNEGYTYDDFYLAFEDSVLFLTADKWTVSRYEDGNVELAGIGEVENDDCEYDATHSGYLLTALTQMNKSDNTDNELNVNINLIYNDAYYEAVLKENELLNASLTITNSGTADTNCVCYIAEYNADGCMTGMARNSEISVPAGETVVTNISKTFSSSNTAKAKIFLWEKGTLVPVGDDIILTAKSADYYANTYATSDSVETNKQICGVINVNTDVDIVKFQTTNAGMYALKFSADNGAAFGLYNLEGKLINAASVDGNYRAYNLSENETYYIKMTGNVNNSYRIKPMVSENVIKNIGVAENLTDVYDCDLYEFTPEEAGSYIITAVGTDGVEATLYNSDFKKLKDSEPGDSYVSFRITESLIANEKYYIVVEQNAGQTEETAYELYIEEPFEIIAVQ